jgi:hypothetical protein
VTTGCHEGPLFLDRAPRGEAVPRYFFVIASAGHEMDDRTEALLPNDNAAIEYARRIIDDLREEHPDDVLSIIVKNAADEVVYRFPGN